MTKTDMIRGLLAQGYRNKEVARLADCHEAYVRAVRLRDAGGPNAEEYRRRKLRTPEEKAYALSMQRSAYGAAREDGLPVRAAQNAAKRAFRKACSAAV